MGKKRVATVNMWLPGNDFEFLSLESDQSLLDADIVVFSPGIPHETSVEQYQGKPLLTESASFKAKQALVHWRDEIFNAVSGGKTVFVYLSKPSDVYAYTGDKQFSGTGRSRVTTNVVTILNSYEALPVRLTGVVPRSGSEIRPVRDLGIFSEYWSEFREIS
jgi:hypothetical protein